MSDDFWRNVDRGADHECWPWLGAITPTGYGRTTASPPLRAHRVAYELSRGPIADGLVIDHLCRNRACCNPAHLEPVTNAVNVLRGVGISAINARKTHCKNGHPFDDENTIHRSKGWRECRACKRLRRHERTAS